MPRQTGVRGFSTRRIPATTASGGSKRSTLSSLVTASNAVWSFGPSLGESLHGSSVADYASVLTAQTARLSAEVSALNLESQRLVASVDLIDAIGGGWQSSQLHQGNEGVTERLGSTVD